MSLRGAFVPGTVAGVRRSNPLALLEIASGSALAMT